MRKMVFVFSLFLSLSTAEAAYLDLTWDLNQEPDLAGYRVYYGTSPGEYINFVDVGLTTTYRLDELLEDVTFFIAITALDSAGNESDFSEEVSGVGVIDDNLVDGSDCGIGGEPTGAHTAVGRSVKAYKSNPGIERGRKLGRKK